MRSAPAIGHVGKHARQLLGRCADAHVLIPLFGAVLLIVIWATTLHRMAAEEKNAELALAAASATLAETYKAQILRNLADIDRTLKIVKHAVASGEASASLQDLQDKGLLPSTLVFTVSVADRAGTVIASSRPQDLGSFIGKNHLDFHLAQDSEQSFVGNAIARDRQGETELQFSQRINDAAGTFDGIAVVSAEPAYFTSGYERPRLGDKGVLALLGRDGLFRVLQTGNAVSWGERADAAITDASNAFTGRLMTNSWDNIERYTSVQPVYGFPLKVVVGLSREEQMAQFADRKRSALFQAGAASAMIIAIALVLSRLLWQLARGRRRMQRAQSTFHAASEASLDAFFIFNCVRAGDGRIVDFLVADVNNRAEQLMGLPKPAMVGLSVERLVPGCKTNGFFNALARVSESGTAVEREWNNRLPAICASWLQCQLVKVERGVVAIVRDISDRKRTELLRTEQRHVLEMIAAGAPLEDVLQRLARLVDSQLPHAMSAFFTAGGDGAASWHCASGRLPDRFAQALQGERRADEQGNGAGIPEERARTCRTTPILSHQQEVLGRFALYAPQDGEPPEADAEIVNMAVRIAGLALERKRTEDRITHMAHHDALTGLPNRTLLEQRIAQALAAAARGGGRIAIAFIDFDNFKLVNDSLGHKAGDELLQALAARMVECVPDGDTVVRLGGDEFVIVLGERSADEQCIHRNLERLRDYITSPVSIAGQQLQMTYSLGVARFPEDGTDPDTLLMNADAAMYRAKELGRNNCQFYTRDINERIHERVTIHDGLRRALARNEFMLHYQPQIDLRTGRIFGMEALIRWQHPEQGMVPPAKFIGIAEQTGLILQIGEWALIEACRQGKAWQDAGLAPVSVAVNVSARQFIDDNLIRQVHKALADSGLDPQHLELEITESMIMQDVGHAIEIMKELNAIGVQMSIDDFGTGYSSLAALKRFPITRLKIDRAFIRDLADDQDDALIAATVISLGHRMGLKVLAEGVETREQLDFLQANGCDETQGYLFSKPVPASEAALLMKSPCHVPQPACETV